MARGKQKCAVQKQGNLIKQKHMTHKKTVAQKIKNQHKSSTESEKIEEPKRK